jgi:hypothetical protein
MPPLSLGSGKTDDQYGQSNNKATITTTVAHGFAVGDTIFVLRICRYLAIVLRCETIATVPSSNYVSVCLAGANQEYLLFWHPRERVYSCSWRAAANNVTDSKSYAPYTRTIYIRQTTHLKYFLLANVLSDYLNIPVMVGLNMLNRNVSEHLHQQYSHCLWYTLVEWLHLRCSK